MNSADWPAPWLRAKLAYEPRDLSLFEAALTHPSASGRNNERLEFLGDAVLNLVVAEHLYRANPDCTEGDLSRLRARVVSGEPLAEVAAALGSGTCSILGSGELKAGGFRRKSILADALEAMVGALFLDGGLDVARRVSRDRSSTRGSPRFRLRTRSRMRRRVCRNTFSPVAIALPRYTVEKVEGEQHAQLFWVMCEVHGLGGRNRAEDQLPRQQGSGSSRRRAEQEAAERILVEITETTGDKDSMMRLGMKADHGGVPAAKTREEGSAGARRARPRANEFPKRLCGARRAAQRRQIHAAERARRREAEHRHAATSDHAPSHHRHRESAWPVQIAFVDTPGLHRGEIARPQQGDESCGGERARRFDLVVFVVEGAALDEGGRLRARADQAVRPPGDGRGEQGRRRASQGRLLPYIAELGARHHSSKWSRFPR